MQLFFPVLHWSETPELRELSLRIKDSDEFELKHVCGTAPDSLPEITTKPDMSSSTADTCPELEFLLGVHAVLAEAITSWMGHPNEEMRKLGLGAIGQLMTETVRSIEHTPSSADYLLELSLLSMLSGVPKSVAPMLLDKEARERATTPRSATEERLAKETAGMSPYELMVHAQKTLPLAGYASVVPELPAEVVQLVEQKLVERRLKNMPAQGTA